MAKTADLSVEWLEVLGTDRATCPDFIAFQQGRTPLEHLDMLDRQRMLEWQSEQDRLRREWEAEESRRNRHNQAELSASADFIQAQMVDATRATAKFQFWAVVVAVLGVIVAAILGGWAIGSEEQTSNGINTITSTLPTWTPILDPETPQPSAMPQKDSLCARILLGTRYNMRCLAILFGP